MIGTTMMTSNVLPKWQAYVLPDVPVPHKSGETLEEWYSRLVSATVQHGRVVIVCGKRERKK